MAKLRNLKIENEALAGVNVADAAEISITITSNVPAVDNKFTSGADVNLTANVTADGTKEKESGVFTIDIAEDSPSEDSPSEDETKVGNRTLSEHLRMRLLGYI